MILKSLFLDKHIRHGYFHWNHILFFFFFFGILHSCYSPQSTQFIFCSNFSFGSLLTIVNCTVQKPRMKWRELPTTSIYRMNSRLLRLVSHAIRAIQLILSIAHTFWMKFRSSSGTPCARTARQIHNFVSIRRRANLCAYVNNVSLCRWIGE